MGAHYFFCIQFHIKRYDLIPAARVIKIQITKREETGSVLKINSERKKHFYKNIIAVRATVLRVLRRSAK